MKLKKIKNAFLFVLTLALVSAAAVAITYALGTSMGTAENTFTSEPNIDVEISELDFDNSTGHGETPHPNDYVLGQEKALKYYPAAIIPKNPKLTNTSPASNDEWVAMTVEYQVKIGTTWYTYPGYSEFKSALASVQTSGTNEFNTTNWEEKTGSNGKVFYYKSKLAKDGNTATLFNNVIINSTFTMSGTNYVITYYNEGSAATANVSTLPDFRINLKGYAVSADTIPSYGDDSKGALDALIGSTNK